MIDAAIDEIEPLVDTLPACRAMGASRAGLYRRRRPPRARAPRPRRAPARALSAVERAGVLEQLHSPRFVDAAPAEVYATLLDEGSYLASERTMYRILAAEGPVRDRRDQLTHPPYARPELLAEKPNEVWSWDISKLKGPSTWTYFYLYVILDVYSRYAIGWTVQHRESAPPRRRCSDERDRDGGARLHQPARRPRLSRRLQRLRPGRREHGGPTGLCRPHLRPRRVRQRRRALASVLVLLLLRRPNELRWRRA